MESKAKMSIYNITYTAIFVVLTIVGAYIKIPIGSVPFTLQFFMCALSGIVLGKKYGPLSQIVYIILGLIGLPVFAGGGGLSYIFQPTFGYILGFVVCSFIIGTFFEFMINKYNKVKKTYLFIVMFSSLIIMYLLGAFYFYLIKNIYLDTPMDFLTVIKICSFPFIISDGIYCIMLSLTAEKINKISKKIKTC
jgi:Uncharacterized conserved protein